MGRICCQTSHNGCIRKSKLLIDRDYLLNILPVSNLTGLWSRRMNLLETYAKSLRTTNKIRQCLAVCPILRAKSVWKLCFGGQAVKIFDASVLNCCFRSTLVLLNTNGAIAHHGPDRTLELTILPDTVMKSILPLMAFLASCMASHAQPTAVSCNPYRLIQYLAEKGIKYQITHEAEIGKSIRSIKMGQSDAKPHKIETYLVTQLPKNARFIKVYKYYESTEPCQLPSYFSALSESDQDPKNKCWATTSAEIKDGYMDEEVIDYHYNSLIKVTVKMGNTSLCSSRKCLMVVSYNLKN